MMGQNVGKEQTISHEAIQITLPYTTSSECTMILKMRPVVAPRNSIEDVGV